MTRVILFGLLGYAYAWLVLGLCVALPILIVVGTGGHGAVLFGKVLLPFFVLAYNILKRSFVRLPPPEGIRLDRRRFAGLYREVNSIRRRARAERVHDIYVSGAINAEMSSVARFGMFGGTVNRLGIGLPLFAALNRDEGLAVIAHEIGHSSRSHGRTSAWVYKQRVRWQQLGQLYSGQESRLAKFFFKGFLDWYWPRFNRVAFELSRAQELEADRVSAEIAGADAARSALFKLLGFEAFVVPEFWRSISELTRSLPEPPEDAFLRFAETARSIDFPRFIEAVGRLPERPGSEFDSHPTTQARIRALGPGPVKLAPPGTSAAEALFGPPWRELAIELGRTWRQQATPEWRNMHAAHLSDQRVLTELGSRPFESLNDEEAYRLASVKNRLPEHREEAFSLFRRVLERNPGHVSALYTLGRILAFERNSDEGLPYLERAMELDPYCRPGAHEAIAAFHLGSGRRELADEHLRLRDIAAHETKLAEKERASLEFHATYLPAEAGEAATDAIRALLREIPEITSAWFVRKKLQYWPEKPLFVLAYENSPAPKGITEQEHTHGLNQRLLKSFPELAGSWLVASLSPKGNRKLKPSVAFVPGAKLK